MKVFLAGASGVIGRPLVPLLIKAGHQVTGTTRSRDKAREIEAAGATAVVVDVYDAAALMKAVQAAKPDVVMHQLTDLPDRNDPAEVAASLARNMRIRVEGTPNLIAAAKAAGARRLISQSLAFVYADGPEPHPETDPLQADDGSPSIRGVLALEKLTLGAPGLDGIVLRYGRLYGPGTWNGDTPPPRSPLHTDAAAQAALLALDHGKPGSYNITEDDGVVSIAKARADLGLIRLFASLEEVSGVSHRPATSVTFLQHVYNICKRPLRDGSTPIFRHSHPRIRMRASRCGDVVA